MNSPETEDRRADWKSDLLKRLHDPLQLRIGVTAIVLALGYGAVYVPMSGQIAETSRKLDRTGNGWRWPAASSSSRKVPAFPAPHPSAC